MVETSNTFDISEDMKAIMKRSLKKDRWNPLNLGANSNYSSESVAARWEKSRSEWLNVSLSKISLAC